MIFDWHQHGNCRCTCGDGDRSDCRRSRSQMIAEGNRLEQGVASLVETLNTVEAMDCSKCEAQEVAGGALAYAPHHTEHGLMVRNLQAENAKITATCVQQRDRIAALEQELLLRRETEARLREAAGRAILCCDARHLKTIWRCHLIKDGLEAALVGAKP